MTDNIRAETSNVLPTRLPDNNQKQRGSVYEVGSIISGVGSVFLFLTTEIEQFIHPKFSSDFLNLS